MKIFSSGVSTLSLAIVLCSVSLVSHAQPAPISLEDIFVKNTFQTKSVRGLRSMNSGEEYTTLENAGKKIAKYSYKTGSSLDVLFDVEKHQTLKKEALENISDYQFNADESRILVSTNVKPIYRHSFTADYYIFDMKNRELKPLSDSGRQQLAVFSPDGYRVAFVRNNNIFIHDMRFGTERQITFDGEFNKISNGAPDWVNEEEFGYSRAFEWAPDGSALAYLKFNESEVKVFNMTKFSGQSPAVEGNELYPSVYSYKYPKAGEKNAVVSVHVYDIQDKTTLTMDIGGGKEELDADMYIPRIKWTKDPKKLAITRLNRLQNKVEVLLTNVRTGKHTILYRDENKYYIAESILDQLTFLDSGNEFVVSSERSGYTHLYLYGMTGALKNAITSGDYDVVDFYGYDPIRKVYYYSSHEDSPLEKYAYSVDSKGKKNKFTSKEGWNEVMFSNNFNYYIHTVSTMTAPPVTRLYDAKHKELRILEDNKSLQQTITDFVVAKQEFFQIPSADPTIMLNAWMMKPLDFQEGKEYPVLITQYSGPNSQQVKNAWTGINWLHYLAQEGFIVVCIDPRGTAARGEKFRKCTYKQLGKIESDDLIASARWLGQQSYVSSSRIGIWGWSYGGFMSCTCILKGNDVFAAAIAVAPVTHFKYYDSIYTERFMRTPQENEEGYEANAPLNMADKLKGHLLLCHGTADDNVHIQNTYELAERLVQANKDFDMAIYTNRNHGISGGNTRLQLYSKFVNFLKKNLSAL
ncbi:peptidase S9 [Bacteroidia bacterium]|nr:peptidase S9 [Bacteroidia bacterium]